MDFLTALKALNADGSLLVEFRGRRYRLVVREGVIRMVVDETGLPQPLPPREAEALVQEIARTGKDAPTYVSWVVQDVNPLTAAIFVPKDSLVN